MRLRKFYIHISIKYVLMFLKIWPLKLLIDFVNKFDAQGINSLS